MVKRFKPPARIVAGLGGVRYTDTMPQTQFTQYVRGQMQGIINNFIAWTDHMKDQSGDVLVEAMRPTFEKTQRIVPVKSGALRRSGYLEKRRRGDQVDAEIGYARGGNPRYAVLQHENLEFYHEPPTSAKFLERPLLEDATLIQDRIIKLYREASGV